MTVGYLLFAHNNSHINYVDIAICNALLIKHHTSDPVTLVTNSPTDHPVFDKVILHDSGSAQYRRFNDGEYSPYRLEWRNDTRASAYDLSPYDETILLDADYLIGDNALSKCWGSIDPVRMNKSAVSLKHEALHTDEQRLEPFGIPLYWATALYFKKSPEGKRFFDTVQHVKDNYSYYKALYRFPGSLFRNDYAFSIAAHILSGWSDDFPSLPVRNILTASERDSLIDVDRKGFRFLSPPIVTRVSGMSVHVMNKFSILRHVTTFKEMFE